MLQCASGLGGGGGTESDMQPQAWRHIRLVHATALCLVHDGKKRPSAWQLVADMACLGRSATRRQQAVLHLCFCTID